MTELPFLGLEVYARAEILALRMLFDPEGIVDDRGRDEQLSLLMDLTLPNIPAMTNRAALGFAFDTQSQPLSFVRTSLGEATGGSVETYTSLLFGTEIVRPSDPSATYDWIDALDMDPPEYTPMEQFAHCLVDGQTNFMEWYFPSRLPLDIGAIGGPDVPDGGWQASFGLRTFDRELIDAPVLAIPGVLTGSDGYDSLTTRLAPTVGDGRRHAGVARDDASGLGLRVVDATALSHVDTMTGADLPFNPTPGAIETFLLEHVAESGTVDLPAMM